MQPKKTIYLIRHGETDNNLKKILQGGNVDISLNKTGRQQAEAFYQRYKSVPFQKIYTSALRRSIESVEKFIEKGIPHETVSDLNEISYGIHDGKISSEGEKSLYKLLINEWDKGNTEAKMEGGESPSELQDRLQHFLDYLLLQEEDLILICMHGRAMRIFLATILHYELSFMYLFQHKNLGLYVLEYTGSMFFIEKFNDTTHLKNTPAQNALV